MTIKSYGRSYPVREDLTITRSLNHVHKQSAIMHCVIQYYKDEFNDPIQKKTSEIVYDGEDGHLGFQN